MGVSISQNQTLHHDSLIGAPGTQPVKPHGVFGYNPRQAVDAFTLLISETVSTSSPRSWNR
jgi:hypothetical protein